MTRTTQRARQAGKANEQRLAEVVHHVLDETSVEAVVTKQHVAELTNEIVEALVAAGAVIPDATEPTVGPKGGAGDSGASGRIIIEPGAIVINNPDRAEQQAVAAHLIRDHNRNVSRYFR